MHCLKKQLLKMPRFWVYILRCQNHSFYTGYTINLFSRYRAHLKGTAAKYTRAFKPLEVAGVWPIYGSKAEAMHIERLIKQLSREEKQKIIEHPFLLYPYVIL